MTTTLLGRGRMLCMTGLLAVLAALPLAALAQDAGSGIPSPEGGSRVVSVSAGDSHTCGVKADGSVACWGDNTYGQAPATLAGPFTALTAGVYHTCGLKSDGSVDCWGWNGYGQAADQAGPFVSVSAGDAHTCGVKSDGSVDCWGATSGNYGQAADQAGPFVSVSAGGFHTCGVKSDGSVACWGRDLEGQAADQAGPFVSVSAGDSHTCGVKSDGSVACWGDNTFGQAVDQAGPFVSVSAGWGHNCGVKTDGSVDCWGYTGSGQAADQSGPFVSVSAGHYHSCGVKTDGGVHCWGAGGPGSTSGIHPHYGQSTIPADLGAVGFGQLAAGNAHACQLKPDGTISCWGDNTDGQATAPEGTFASVVAGDAQTCAISGDGVIACWGIDGSAIGNIMAQTASSYGTRWNQMTLAPTRDLYALGLGTPAEARAMTTWTQLSGGGTGTSFYDGLRNLTHSYATSLYGRYCGVRHDGSGYCVEPSHDVAIPAGPWQRLESGLNHQCGLKADGTLECWGDNSEGQTTNVPTGLFRALGTGYNHACAIRENGTLACWGSNIGGQATPPTGTFVQVSAGNTFTCAIRDTGTRVCWGAGAGVAVALVPGTLPNGVTGTAYSQQFSLSGDAANLPSNPVYGVSDGNLPPGLSLSAAGVLSGTPTSVGIFTFSIDAEGDGDFAATQSYSIAIVDPTPPVISHTLTPLSIGINGWYTGDVIITWSVIDPESTATKVGCVDSTLNADTAPAGMTYSCSATSAGGSTGPVTVVLKRDATKPTIAITPSPAANAAGWNKADVSLLVNCGDATPGSGIASCPSLANVTTDGTTTIAAQQATDNAGNASVASAPLTIKLDKTAPTLAPTVPSPLLRGGSYSATPNASDATSGIATSSCGALDTSSSGSKSTTCSATDNAGNSKTVTLNYTVTTTCSNDGYTGTQLTWCRNICEMGYTGATLDIWIHRWINRYRALPYCRVTAPQLQ